MFVGELRPYQDDAVDRMVERGSLLLSYDQGTGKTVCAIAASEQLMGDGAVTTTLIVVLSSLKLQWASALADFTDVRTRWLKIKDQYIRVPSQDQCVIINGGPEQRARLYEQIAQTQPEYVICSYDSVIYDWRYIKGLDVQCIILDECTQIKSFRAERSKKLKRLWAPYRFGLTGTPVDNGKLEEVYSIMQWVDPDVFGRWDLFEHTYIDRHPFGAVRGYKQLDLFHETLSTAMSRKTVADPDVSPFMPRVEFRECRVQLDFPTRRAYKRIAADLSQELMRARSTMRSFDLAAYYSGGRQVDERSAQGKIMARMLAAQMLLNHPDLLRKSAADWQASEKRRREGVEKATWPGSLYAYEIVSSGLLDHVTSSPKLDRVVAEIREILAEDPDHKVIVFSFFRDMGEIVAKALPEYGSVVFHGQLSVQAKAAAKQKFATDPATQLFLASDAGGYGLDLPQASHLINVDLAMSSGAQDQRNSRHRRTSSEWGTIHVIDVLVDDTLEIRKAAQLDHKRRVARAALDGKGAVGGEVISRVESLTRHLEQTAA